MRIYGASDFAVTADGGDFTVHVVAGVNPDGKLFLLDVWRKQAASDVWVESLCDLMLEWKPIGWATEKGQIASGIGPYLDRRQRERRAYALERRFQPEGTNQCERSLFAVLWRRTDFTSRPGLLGMRPCVRRCCLSRPAGTMTWSMPSDFWANCWIRCRPAGRQRRPGRRRLRTVGTRFLVRTIAELTGRPISDFSMGSVAAIAGCAHPIRTGLQRMWRARR